MNYKNFLVYLMFMFLLITLVNARQQDMNLLSAYRSGNETLGGIAKVSLEIKPGQDRVFFQSYPLNQIDTQISTRFAKQYACDFLDVGCSGLDFFYTISAPGAIIGGPSAGAAITVLTIATLDNVDINQDVVMTGTINSGGLIGPVGATTEKIEAAKKNGFTKVLIPKWTSIKKENESIKLNISSTEENNNSAVYNYELINTNKLLDINTIKVNHVSEALYYFTGKNYSESRHLKIPENYLNLMNKFSKILCNKTKALENNVNLDFNSFNYSQNYKLLKNLTINKTLDNISNESLEKIELLKLKLNAFKQYNNSKIAAIMNRSYSQASFCFASNLALEELILKNQSNETLNKKYLGALNELNELKDYVNNIEIDSIIKLQTKQLVLDRIIQAEEYVSKLNKELTPKDLAYFIERTYSAKIWSRFFDVYSEKQVFDQNTLKNICKEKIMQAQERISYIELQTYIDVSNLNEEINKAITFSNKKDYEMCIYLASQTKANSNLILSNSYLYSANLSELVNEKISIVEDELAKETREKIFPIAGISYLQYAKSLKDQDPYSALLYSEYAIELGKMKMYLPKKAFLSNLPYYLENKFFIILSFSFGILLFGIFCLVFKIRDKFKK